MTSLTLALALSAVGPARLTGPADVIQLCRHLTGLMDGAPSREPVERARQAEAADKAHQDALDREYEIRLDAREFRFGEYDPRAEVLDVGSRLAAGHGLLDLQPGDVALELDASPAEASQAYKLWRRGQGSLRVTFDLDDATTCDGSPQSPPWLLPVRVLSLSFVDDRGELLLNGANGLAAHVVDLDRPPGISVQPVVALQGVVDPARVAGSIQRTAGLQQCYARALGQSPQLEGTVVFRALIDRQGRPSALQVAIEDLGQPELVGCLGESLKTSTFAGAAPGAQLLVPLELRRM